LLDVGSFVRILNGPTREVVSDFHLDVFENHLVTIFADYRSLPYPVLRGVKTPTLLKEEKIVKGRFKEVAIRLTTWIPVSIARLSNLLAATVTCDLVQNFSLARNDLVF